MPQSTIASDIHQTLDVHLNFTTQFTLYRELILNDAGDSTDIIIRPVFHLDILIYTCLLKDVTCLALTNPEDVGQADNTSFIPW